MTLLRQEHTHSACGWAQNDLPMYDLPVRNISRPMRESSKAYLCSVRPNVTHHLLSLPSKANIPAWPQKPTIPNITHVLANKICFSLHWFHWFWYQPDRIFCVRKWQRGCRKSPVISHRGVWKMSWGVFLRRKLLSGHRRCIGWGHFQ